MISRSSALSNRPKHHEAVRHKLEWSVVSRESASLWGKLKTTHRDCKVLSIKIIVIWYFNHHAPSQILNDTSLYDMNHRIILWERRSTKSSFKVERNSEALLYIRLFYYDLWSSKSSHTHQTPWIHTVQAIVALHTNGESKQLTFETVKSKSASLSIKSSYYDFPTITPVQTVEVRQILIL